MEQQQLSGIFFIVSGCIFIVSAFKAFRRYRGIEDTPTSKISTASQGHVELRGTALALDQEIFRSYHGQRVLYRRYQIHEKVVNDGKTEWRKIREESFGTVFYVQDATGLAEVIIAGMDLLLPEQEFPYSILQQQDESQLMNAVGGVFSTLRALNIVGGEQKMTEWVIPENSPIFLQGNFKTFSKTVAGKQISAVVSQHGERPSFLSTDGEGQLVNKEKWKFVGMLLLGSALVCIGYAQMA